MDPSRAVKKQMANSGRCDGHQATTISLPTYHNLWYRLAASSTQCQWYFIINNLSRLLSEFGTIYLFTECQTYVTADSIRHKTIFITRQNLIIYLYKTHEKHQKICVHKNLGFCLKSLISVSS